MPANTSDILLNSISSPKPVSRPESKSDASQSFAEHWTLQSKKSPQNLGRELHEPRERPERLSPQQSNANDRRHDRQADKHQDHKADATPETRRSDSAAGSSRAEMDRASHNKAASRAEAEKPDSSDTVAGKTEKQVSSQRPSVDDESNPPETVHENTPAQSQQNSEQPSKELSAREKFLLALLGVSDPATSDKLAPENGEDSDGSGESGPESFIELLLTGGSSAKNNDGEQAEAEGPETLDGLQEGEDLALPGEAESSAQETEVIAGDLEVEAEAVMPAAVSNKVAEQVSGLRAVASAESKHVTSTSESKSTLTANPLLNETAVEGELGDDAAQEDSPGELIAQNAKSAQGAHSLSGLLKEASPNVVPREIVASPSATGYGEAAGINHSQSQGRLSGLEHSFQMQRSADVQGRSSMQSDLNQAQWKAEVAEKVAWFSARNISRAEIRLDPPELGSLQIKIQLNQEQAQVTINSPHASVREALDQTSARLREMFQEQGLDLTDVNVGGEGAQQRSDEHDSMAGMNEGEEPTEPEAAAPPVIQRLGLVDSYA
ncbi:flagellar hook-length control protein FliK [Pseudoteredinibacter isoporae]|uniref:Flagellar hook-length control protein FliK n=1 Tax=Pseudoteredinibacter isoporae TaxID=570281 RepID=A0A7X0JWF0_9GAMM|nr:flagellar hook-length control protein FliK [Pseudoteredinibacter isoporae]MBB6523468.1 flagellar hook-length control protein FliK [Pseudoteredinibacter isoporae]NHO88977.1 hypothetical protein [Pseudoteredinibacter isoporae]NIB24315.1 hypothetical protein [Pseudoteredinibacter isoporae]